MPRRCFVLDLVDRPELIAEYEGRHAPGAVWLEVVAHLKAQGIEAMEIWRAGERLVMIAEVSEDYPRPVDTPEAVQRWEAEMWRYQRALPGAADGEKWRAAARIFVLDEQGG